ncbi:MAG: peptidoglycan DD-metalloendopeptidase family protein, partial [Clostridia bacterium]|nr:peptidoglycan DD-metalloendopeptidase family protein [Clostridia bacterium]
EDKGEDVTFDRQFLEHHTPLLRLISFFPRKVGGLFSWCLSFWKKDGGERAHRSKISFLSEHRIHFAVVSLALFVAAFAVIQLSKPVVLRATIDGNVIGIVENKHLVDSAVNELEDNVEIILGETFHFPYEIQYSFKRAWGKKLTEKSKVSEILYTYVSEYICTAGGLYVDDVLVAVCENEEVIRQGLQEFVDANAVSGESGIFNDILVVTQAYPTESILSYDQFQQLLKEMSVPLEERKKEPIPGESVLTEALPQEEEEKEVPDMVLVADSSYIPEVKKVSYSNYPKSIDGLKLDLYTYQIQSYETDIPYETVYTESRDHYTSMADVTTRGADGKAIVEAKIYYVNGKEARREIVRETVTKAPVNRVISIGSKVLPEDLGLFGAGNYIVPRVGLVTYYYEIRGGAMHYGWDIPADEGENVYAAASGKVVVAIGPDGAKISNGKKAEYFVEYGYCVVIEHENGYSTLYAHCSAINVTLGQEVKQGEKIGEIGNTGKSSGNHVHFEVMKDGKRVNPAPLLYQGKTTIYDR